MAGVLLASGQWEHSGAASWVEDFASAPSSAGWARFGDPSLFTWDPVEQHLEVIWDSSRPNSYFYRALGTILTKQEDFSLEFELRLEQIDIGVDPAKPYTFELAVGLLRVADATSSNFFRGSGINPSYGPRNLVEFDYFPDSGYGATLAPTVVSTNNRIAFSNNHPLEMTLGDLFRVQLAYTASDQVLRSRAWRNGQPFALPPAQDLAELFLAGFPDFRLDAMAVSSYSDGRQDPRFAGSILARGMVDNIVVQVPDPPVRELSGGFSNGVWRMTFVGQPDWSYTLERSTNLQSWISLSAAAPTQPGPLHLEDASAALLTAGFYRIRAERP